MQRKYGCIRGPKRYSFSYQAINPFPVHILNVDLRKQHCPDILDQTSTSSCTGHGTYWAIRYAYLNDKKKTVINPSPLFLYWNGRASENSTAEDSGAVINDVVNGAMTYGVCDVSLWPDEPHLVLKKPSDEAFATALKTKALTVQTVDNSRKENILQCLYDGFPVVFGMQVPESFESDDVKQSGILEDTTGRSLGGHCLCIVGYKKNVDRFIVANSWGTTWGQDGYVEIPASYICSGWASDFHTINTVQ